MKRTTSGFTLVELLVAIAIMGLFITVADFSLANVVNLFTSLVRG